MRSPAKKLTREAVRENPILGMLARIRLKQAKAARDAKKASELDLD
jgi:hypothetical protein